MYLNGRLKKSMYLKRVQHLSVHRDLVKIHLQMIEIRKAMTVRKMRIGRKNSLASRTCRKLTFFIPYIAYSGLEISATVEES
jgi:hypothetical protein